MKDIGEASYVIDIRIRRDILKDIIRLSQETYINKVLERFWMKNCLPNITLIVKGDKFNINKCPKNNLEKEQMKNIFYAFTIENPMYAHVYTRHDIVFVMGMLG
jgi:hypothetical protein